MHPGLDDRSGRPRHERQRPASRRSRARRVTRSRRGRCQETRARFGLTDDITGPRVVHRPERASGRDQSPAVGPPDQVGRIGLGQLGRVGHRQDNRPVHMRCQFADHVLGEGLRSGRRADQDRGMHPADDLGEVNPAVFFIALPPGRLGQVSRERRWESLIPRMLDVIRPPSRAQNRPVPRPWSGRREHLRAQLIGDPSRPSRRRR